MNIKELQRVLPEFPRTRHLPYKPNMVTGDLLAADEDVTGIFTQDGVYVEEKVDGANSGMALYEDHPVIRNRNHILMKGFVKDTPAKKQFAPIWNWFYKNKKKFQALESYSVYGEWMYALHGIRYDKLPDLFIAYDVYDYSTSKMLDPAVGRGMLQDAGFVTPELLHQGKVTSWEQLEALCNGPSQFSTIDRREGLVVKMGNGREITGRYKMIRSDFVQGCNWNESKLVRNPIV